MNSTINPNNLFEFRKTLIYSLWEGYLNEIHHAKAIVDFLSREHKNIIIDHFALIDLPGKNSGIPILSQIFSSLGFIIRGSDYLPEKQNEFLWMVEEGAEEKYAHEVLPQVVLADFRLQELPVSIRKIIEKYADQINTSPLFAIKDYCSKFQKNDYKENKKFLSFLVEYFNNRIWGVPTLTEFRTVQEANELLAWVLLFGRKPNHFTISVHLLEKYLNLQDFHHKLPDTLKYTLNDQGTLFKGRPEDGIMQSSSLGEFKKMPLADTYIKVRDSFIEFVWRYPKKQCSKPRLWRDYYTGFIANNANKVVESLYT